jgi:hypothetical protein
LSATPTSPDWGDGQSHDEGDAGDNQLLNTDEVPPSDYLAGNQSHHAADKGTRSCGPEKNANVMPRDEVFHVDDTSVIPRPVINLGPTLGWKSPAKAVQVDTWKERNTRENDYKLCKIDALPSSGTSRWRIKARLTKKGDIHKFTNTRGDGKLMKIDLQDQNG